MTRRLSHGASASIKTIDAAVRHLDGDHPTLAKPNPHYSKFVKSITRVYPGGSANEDGDDGLWPEGLDDSPCYEPTFNLMINLDMLDQDVMDTIAKHADAAGLQILDEQNGLLYGPGPAVISIHDERRKAAPHQFVLDALSALSPRTHAMFGCLAVYVEEKIVFILRDKRDAAADRPQPRGRLP